MAMARPSQTPAWLRHAEIRWLQRPIAKSELRRVLSDESPTSQGSQTSAEELTLHTRSGDILLVEDSPINQTVLRGILVQLGHAVTLARNGAEAVQLCAEHAFDVVLMDIQMPEVDGLEATRRIRSREVEQGREPVHVIALTAHAMPSDREQSRAAGMNGFLVKPIPMESLRRALSLVPTLASDAASSHSPSISPPHSDQALRSIRDELARVDLDQWRQIDQMMGNNSELATEIVSLLRTEAARLWEELRIGVDQQQAREVRRAAHTLKSNLRNVALPITAELFGKCELAAQKEQWSELVHYMPTMSESIDALDGWCKHMLQLRD